MPNFKAEGITVPNDADLQWAGCYKELGSGSYRRVLALTEDLVIKFAFPNSFGSVTHSDARACNEREVILWTEMVKDYDKHLFSAVHGWADDYSWVIHERVEIRYTTFASELTPREQARMRAVTDRAANKYRVADLGYRNLGVRADESWCVVDYGNHKRW